MSTLHVENLKGLSSGGNANKIIVPSGQTLQAPGHIIQVARMTSSGTVTFANSYNAYSTFMTGSITPKSSSSQILVMGNCELDLGSTAGANYPAVNVRIVRGGSQLKQFFYRGYRDSYNNHTIITSALFYLDSPSSTSSLSYEVQGSNMTGSSFSGTYSGRANNYTASEVFLMELAQ